ncbi:MAG: MBL fold metallo-hydrolase [Planctomycetes bacterium]|nr:MBL fold metallo-hydrolase [Planctomycetota bacterium]
MSFSFSVLASGSSGNSTLISTGETRFLIDAGTLPRAYLPARLAELGMRCEDLHGILVTHAHSDHLGSAAFRLAEDAGVPLYVHPSLLEAKFATPSGRRRQKHLRRFQLQRRLHTFDGEPFRLRDVWVEPLPTPHGDRELIGATHAFRLRAEGPAERVLLYATDLGHFPEGLVAPLASADAAVLESNHDPELERRSGRPEALKTWVLGDRGHLSNAQAAEAAARAFATAPGRARTLVLAHLSEQCNAPELAGETTRAALTAAGVTGCRVVVARRSERTEQVDV